MACTRKTRNTAVSPSAASASSSSSDTVSTTASAAAAADAASAEAAQSAFADVPMRRYAHPIPTACDPYYCQSLCQGFDQSEREERLIRLLRRQSAQLKEIRALLMQILASL